MYITQEEYDSFKQAKEALAEAANEINCAGPVAHRIRVMKQEHQDHIERLKKKLEYCSKYHMKVGD